MSELNLVQKIQTAVDYVHKISKIRPEIGIILGSGLGSLADEAKNATAIPYSDIPYFNRTSVEGHAGRLVLGMVNNIPVAFLQGRFHHYEGYSMEEVVFPTRTLCRLGIKTLILTNAAGGINTRYQAGDLMIIEDQLNLMGQNPLRGHNFADLGPRFPDMTEAYSQRCVKIFQKEASQVDFRVHTGVYAGLLGPTYETPAEVRMLRTLGADAVGMSTVPEAIAANHMGMEVAGVSCITNQAAGLSPHKLSHQEVIEASHHNGEKMKKFILSALPAIAGKGSTG